MTAPPKAPRARGNRGAFYFTAGGRMLHSSKKDTWEAHRIELGRAKDHVFNARRIVEHQRDRVAKFKVNGNCAPIYEVTLRAFETTLNSLENHVALLKRELGE